MKSFITFLLENNSDIAILEKAKKLEKYIDPKLKILRTRYIEALDTFIEAVKAGQIYNADFVDNYKYGINMALEKAYQNIYYNKYVDKFRENDFKEAFKTSYINVQNVKKAAEHYAKYKDKYPELYNALELVKDLPDVIKKIKGTIIKGRKPKEVKPGQFVKPMPSNEANKFAVKFLKEAVKSFETKLRKSIRETYLKKLKDIKLVNNAFEAKKDPFISSIIYKVYENPPNGGTTSYLKELKLKPKPDSEIKKLLITLADRLTDEIIEKFVAKNTSKLSLIFQKKKEIKNHKILRTNIRNDSLENEMYFEFADGSSFTISSKIVYVFLRSGKISLKYPTRFHNVKLADGTKMKMPSEEKMIKKF